MTKKLPNSYLMTFSKIGIVIFWLILILFAVEALLPNTTFTKNKTKSSVVKALIPEGWGFYTKNPREPVLYIYQYKEDQDKWEMITKPNFSPSFFFGINRNGRALTVEIKYLLDKINRMNWQESKMKYPKKTLPYPFFKIKEQYSIENNSLTNFLGGKILVLRKKIVPWAWADDRNRIEMPADYIVLNIN